MVVVVIIGVLVAIIIPTYGHIQDRAAIKTHEANLRAIDEAIVLYVAQFGHGPISVVKSMPSNPKVGDGIRAVDELVSKGFLSERPKAPMRLLKNTKWFAPPYNILLQALQKPFNITTLYYEIHETTYDGEKTFPVLDKNECSSTYRADEKPKKEDEVIMGFVKAYNPRGDF